MVNTRILYLEAKKRDFRAFMNNNPGYFRHMGSGKIAFTPKVAEDPPWIYVRASDWQNCNLWHRVMFDQILEKKHVPIACHSCWKVVIMPRNLEELMATWIMQLEIEHPCKCGTEGNRANTNRIYGGYWYNNSIEEGMECYRRITHALKNQIEWRTSFAGVPIRARFGNEYLPEPGTLPKVILKRGCTEYEQNCGPSDQWVIGEDQVELENIVLESFDLEVSQPKQTENHLASIWMDFIHKAYQWGDPSYKAFTNNNRLFNPPVTYHDKDQDFIDSFK